MTAWRVLKYVLFLALVAGGGYAFWKYKPLETQTTVQLGTVEKGDLTLKVTVAGGVVPRHKALITAPYAGYVRKLFVKIGDKITVGSPVVSIAQTVGSTDEDVFPLRSPLTGVVVQVWKTEGEAVTTTGSSSGGDPTLVRVDDITKLFVEASVPEVEIAKLKLGQPVVIRAMAVQQKTYKGKITQITQAAREGDRWDRSKVEFPITVEVTDPDEELKPGMSAVLDVIVKEAKNVLTLRHEYVQKDGAAYVVTTADGLKKPITVGMQNEDAFEIKSGVAEGEKIRQVDFLAIAPAGG